MFEIFVFVKNLICTIWIELHIQIIIKNIDYDLDVKLYPDRTYQVLDENEYFEHAKKMNYSDDVMDIVEAQLDKLIMDMEEEKEPFNKECIDKYYQLYLKMSSHQNIEKE